MLNESTSSPEQENNAERSGQPENQANTAANETPVVKTVLLEEEPKEDARMISESLESSEAGAIPSKVAESEVVNIQTENSTPAENQTAPQIARSEKGNEETDTSLAVEDYQRLTLDQIVELLRQAIKEELTPTRREQIEDMRVAFYKNLRSQRENERREWIVRGEDPEAFEPSHVEAEEGLKEVMFAYRASRKAQAEAQERERQENLAAKRAIIERIRELTSRDEVKGETFREFDSLRKEWKTIGFVPQAEADDLYQSYHHQVQNFYDYLNINRELRDLDYKKNLDEKQLLCERAEDLLTHDDPIAAFKQLQELHTQWKEIGPVFREKSDEIWERFSSATARINQRHREHYEGLRAEYEANLAKKIELCEQVEGICNAQRETSKEWLSATSTVVNLQKEWRTIGPVPKRQNNKIWERFQAAAQRFFTARRAFDQSLKELGQENIQLKLDLCAQAEALKESTEWRKTTEEMVDLQRRWKEIGYTPYKRGNELWQRFRSAMDYYFERRNEHNSTERNQQKDNLKAKEAILAELEAYEIPSDPKEGVEWLKEIQARWGEIGFVPFKYKDTIHTRYRELLDKLYSALRIDRREQQMISFKQRVEELREESHSGNSMSRERSRLTDRIRTLEAERLQMENNLGFFTSSSPNNPILQQLQGRLDSMHQEIEMLREKIKVLDRSKEESEKKE